MPAAPVVRSYVRKVLSWLFFGVVVAIIIAMLAEFFIEVVRDKGMYADAGKRWDALVSAVLSVVTSGWAVIPFTLLAGVVGGLWLDYYLRKAEPAPGLSTEQVEELLAARLGPNQRETVAETFAASDGRAGTMIDHFTKRIDELAETFGDQLRDLQANEQARTTADLRKDALLAKLYTQTAESDDRIQASLNERIDLVAAEAKELRGTAEASRAATNHVLGELREMLRLADVEERTFRQQLETWVGKMRDDFRRQIENIDRGILTILDRERLLELADVIAKEGDRLSGPTRHEPIADQAAWDSWLEAFREWRVKLRGWARIASEHREITADRVNATTEDDYRGKWTALDSYFPNAQAVQDYKTFRILLRNFHAERQQVDTSVQSAAFMRPSMKGRLYPSPRDGDQMPLPRPGTE